MTIKTVHSRIFRFGDECGFFFVSFTCVSACFLSISRLPASLIISGNIVMSRSFLANSRSESTRDRNSRFSVSESFPRKVGFDKIIIRQAIIVHVYFILFMLCFPE